MILIHNCHRAAKQADKTTFPVFGGIVKRRISQIAGSDPWRVWWTLALGRDRFCYLDLVKILIDYWLIITIQGSRGHGPDLNLLEVAHHKVLIHPEPHQHGALQANIAIHQPTRIKPEASAPADSPESVVY
ncbi:MAG TPA: hypothetical protein VGA79_08685 [Desulfobaccales bacterium]|jgi:hypothetical protein